MFFPKTAAPLPVQKIHLIIPGISVTKILMQKSADNPIQKIPIPANGKVCLACGKAGIGNGRRYCSKACRSYIEWVLSLSKGLLRALNTRYAAFSFTSDQVILDVFPIWSEHISRFMGPRTRGRKPAEDLKRLVLEFGTEWHEMVKNNRSMSYASLHLVNRNHEKSIAPDQIKPDQNSRPRLSKHETGCLRILKLKRNDLSRDGSKSEIKTAYKRMAKVYHPDVGGDEDKFKKLNDAHEQMLLWAENPQYTTRKALQDCWSYDGFTSRWSPPL